MIAFGNENILKRVCSASALFSIFRSRLGSDICLTPQKLVDGR